MSIYQNLGGESNVSEYFIESDSISVKFGGSPRIYTYSNDGKAGEIHVDYMKVLAKQGQGLNSYINRKVKLLYDK